MKFILPGLFHAILIVKFSAYYPFWIGAQRYKKKDISCVLYFEKNAMKPVLIINKLKHKKKANNILRSPFM